MLIKGLIKSSLLDFPSNFCCTVFLAGCNFRCGYCYNPKLIEINNKNSISEEDFFTFLDTRKGKLDGVCILGGEPLIHNEIQPFIKKIKDKGFKVKIDTNGSNPNLLKELINKKLINYVAMDIKASKENYQQFFHQKDYINEIEQSIEILKQSNIDYEFRTTIIPSIIDEEELKKICKWLQNSKKFCLQQFDKRYPLLDDKFKEKKLYTPNQMKQFLNIAKPYFKKVELRNV